MTYVFRWKYNGNDPTLLANCDETNWQVIGDRDGTWSFDKCLKHFWKYYLDDYGVCVERERLRKDIDLFDVLEFENNDDLNAWKNKWWKVNHCSEDNWRDMTEEERKNFGID